MRWASNDNRCAAPFGELVVCEADLRADFRAGRIDKAEAIKRLNALGIE